VNAPGVLLLAAIASLPSHAAGQEREGYRIMKWHLKNGYRIVAGSTDATTQFVYLQKPDGAARVCRYNFDKGVEPDIDSGGHWRRLYSARPCSIQKRSRQQEMSNRRLAPAEIQPETFAFTADNENWTEREIQKYPPGRQASAVIPLLWRAQEQAGGWLPQKAI